MRTGIIKD
ncbi:hypothetical protein EYZ11_011263 [Aspergillus tanneri]|uniref:Uncharacterized protein n=1 Tax=Aspergillus tanneri TaxID=1220188 RepID=A0A4S3J5D9_9EURO|nr:hypothetical protein EYZ11_011263 [Aspergillus tanneri]